MAQETDPEQVFEVLERMGEGSYGSVYKARHKKSNRIVAIKIIPADSDLNDLMKEISILKECKSDFIIRYYGSYYKEGDLWIVMEFGDCGSLADSLNKESGVFSEREIQYLLASILLGIAYLHAHKKIHRDIKAGNVLLTKEGKAKLADFGVSAKLDTTLSKRNTVIGTPFWMAPEIIQEISYNGKADIWSLGITAIELAEGQPPYSNIHPMRAIFMIPNRPPPRLRANSKWSPMFANFVATCLEKDPDRRPTAQELLQHPFVKDVAVELEANKGSSEVMKKMVDRLMIRREELAKLHKSVHIEGGADFGNTIVTQKEEPKHQDTIRVRVSDHDSSTIVLKKRESLGNAAAEEPVEDGTIRELPQKPVVNAYRMNAPAPRSVMMIPPAKAPAAKKELHTPPPKEPSLNSQPRSQFFSPHGNCAPNAGNHLPMAHLQMSLGGTKNHTDSQKVVLEMMPTLSSKQPVHGSHKTEWMKLRRRGEELREQFASDFDALYKTYLAEIERIDGEMKKIEDST